MDESSCEDSLNQLLLRLITALVRMLLQSNRNSVSIRCWSTYVSLVHLLEANNQSLRRVPTTGSLLVSDACGGKARRKERL